MKRICLVSCAACMMMLSVTSASAQHKRELRKYLKDSLPALVARCQDLLDRAYMAQELLGVSDTLPGWEGFSVKLYEYKTGKDIYTGQPKTGKVYLLEPTPERLARWIVSTAWTVKKSVDYRYINRIFMWIRNQSGGQFPVKGVVYEDQYTKGFQEPYVFYNGVTVYVKDSSWFPQDKTCTPAQLDYYLRITPAELNAQTGQYARIASTTREDYKKAGGKVDVGSKDDRKQTWLNVVRDLYKKAMRSDRNELMIMWAESHLEAPGVSRGMNLNF